jgi:hypothetical protein
MAHVLARTAFIRYLSMMLEIRIDSGSDFVLTRNDC